MLSGKSLAAILIASLAVLSCKRGDLPFFELHGKVRAVSWTGGSGLTSGQWDFAKDGKLERGTWEVEGRDARGRIRSAVFTEVDRDSREEFRAVLEFSLSRRGALASAINRNDFGEYEYILARDGDGQLVELSLRDMADSVYYIYNYSGYESDSRGNWTSRRFTVTCGGTVINSGTESRDIVYFDE